MMAVSSLLPSNHATISSYFPWCLVRWGGHITSLMFPLANNASASTSNNSLDSNIVLFRFVFQLPSYFWSPLVLQCPKALTWKLYFEVQVQLCHWQWHSFLADVGGITLHKFDWKKLSFDCNLSGTEADDDDDRIVDFLLSSYTGYHFLEAVSLVATVEGLTGIVFRIEVVFRVIVQCHGFMCPVCGCLEQCHSSVTQLHWL